MASNLGFALFLSMLCFLPSPSSSAETSSSLVSTSTVCSYTRFPSFCRTILPNNNSASVYDYGRMSFQKSLLSAQKFLSLIDGLLRFSSSLTPGAVSALQDCKFLATLNVDYLGTSMETLSNNTNTLLPIIQADDVQTLFSGILTNIETCLDGIEETASSWIEKNGVVAPLDDDAKLYSVSLALFTKGWVPDTKHGVPKRARKHLPFRNGTLPFRMSTRHKDLFESLSRRKLLQSSDDGQVMVSDIVVVSQDGQYNFTTITDAVKAAPNNTNVENGYFLIYITAGVYEEYVSIPKYKKYLMMIGDGINRTIVTGNHSVADGWTTFGSPSFAVVSQGFVAVDITFQNTAGASKGQAVAVRNGADLSTFYSCSIEGYQDTLYVHSLRQFYRECDIYGTVDFIFGNAAVVFQNCNIYPTLPLIGQSDTITAQGRSDPNQNTGISIHNCTIKPSNDLATANFTVQTYLGRPWQLYSRTVYMQSFMDSFINPLGWSQWNGNFALDTLYYAEYNNTGPGSNTAGRVNWPGYHVINATDAGNFTVSTFLLGDDWLPLIGVPYTGGLI
ncbi:Pectinesterase [Bertholletia excelsa]